MLLKTTLFIGCSAASMCTDMQTLPSSLQSDKQPQYTKQLIGTWQSTEDPQAVIRITQVEYIEFYGSEKLSSSPYILTYSCRCDDSIRLFADTYRILVVHMQEEKDCYCYAISKLTSSTLSLIYVGRGNELRYKRLQ